ncbi:FKBP-type peptidyl-prolyl cis-trans isomerase [Hyalangium minutum]|uniref:Peptidyl-prolyl cis-trans isomerase n=1 Tax=Hyalangium minutum TaxID=394096 RepID=A0A085WRG4_9BACT|nr:FKBP-type peptidyl-prolyl cis-trans isomerase [Hyalangium minutum]KFE70277.1 FKBP-type peptidyl-prolyl cis-trans isomerase FkpA precursor [Hyalangium minutum]
MRTKLLATVVMGLLASQAWAQGKAKPAPAAAPSASAQPQTDEEKTMYAYGFQFGKSLGVLALSPQELEMLKKGLTDAHNNAQPVVNVEEFGPKIQTLARTRQNVVSERFLENAAKEKGAQKLPSGIIYQELKAGTGSSPKASDTVAVHYRGTLTSGEEFDSSYKRNQVAEFPLNGVIACWTEGVQKMKVGGKAKLTCPANKAYGERPPPGSKIPPNAVLQFEIELVNIPGFTGGK